MGPWGRFVEDISSKLAFFPPSPPSYEILRHSDNGEEYIHPTLPNVPQVQGVGVKVITTRPCKPGGLGGGQQVVTVFCPFKSTTGTSAKVTLLYSHGNAVDLGQMLPVYRELAKLLKVNVCGYDYSGYGCSSGLPTANETLCDISSVYAMLKEERGLEARRIILYGQSVGSGPSAYLASVQPDVGGVVLHSALLSGIRVLNPGLKWWPSWADVYPNHLLAPKIKSPVLVMHGTEDEVIDISCGRRLYELVPNKTPPLWAQGCNHQNLERCALYLPMLEAFIRRVATAADTSVAGAAAAGRAGGAGGTGSAAATSPL